MRDASGSAQGTAWGCQGMGIRSYFCLGDAVAQPGSLKEWHEAQLRNSVPTRAPLRGRAIDSPERSEHRWVRQTGLQPFTQLSLLQNSRIRDQGLPTFLTIRPARRRPYNGSQPFVVLASRRHRDHEPSQERVFARGSALNRLRRIIPGRQDPLVSVSVPGLYIYTFNGQGDRECVNV